MSYFKNSLLVKKGAVRIEFLVVLLVIITVTIAANSIFTKAQILTRDTKRKAELESLSQALELAKSSSRNNLFYPACPQNKKDCILNASNGTSNPELDPKYIIVTPSDPLGGGSCNSGFAYCYSPTPQECTGTTGPNPCTGYTINACLENESAKVNDIKIFISSSCPSGRQYEVTNPY